MPFTVQKKRWKTAIKPKKLKTRARKVVILIPVRIPERMVVLLIIPIVVPRVAIGSLKIEGNLVSLPTFAPDVRRTEM